MYAKTEEKRILIAKVPIIFAPKTGTVFVLFFFSFLSKGFEKEWGYADEEEGEEEGGENPPYV